MKGFLHFSIARKLILETHIPPVAIHHLSEFGLFHSYRDKNTSIFNFRRKFRIVLEVSGVGVGFVHKSHLIEFVLSTLSVIYDLKDLEKRSVFLTELGPQNGS